MSEPDSEPTLGDAIEPTEQAPRDREEHGKAPAKPDDDELAHRTEQERIATGLENYDPDEIASATE